MRHPGLRRIGQLVAIALLAISCGQSAPSASPSASPSPAPTPTTAGVSVVVSVETYNGSDTLATVHEVTVVGGNATDREVIANGPISLRDVSSGLGLGTTARSTRLATLNLRDGTIRAVGPSYSSGTGGPGTTLSPDRSQATLQVGTASGKETLIMNLTSGNTRRLLMEGSRPPWITPFRWTADGIYARRVGLDPPITGLFKVDARTGSLTTVTNDQQVQVLSPQQARYAGALHRDLGDATYSGQGNWHNTVYVAALGGGPNQIIAQKSRDFVAFDVTDSGDVLFASNDSPFPSQQSSSDTGLYFASDGHPWQQFSQSQTWRWVGGRLIGGLHAVVAQAKAEGVEIDLVSLCPTLNGCAPGISRIATIPSSPYNVNVRVFPG